MTDLEGDWILLAVGDMEITEATILKFSAEDLTFSYGNDYCQKYTAKDGKVMFEQPTGTKKHCTIEPPESDVVNAITNSTDYIIDPDRTLKLMENGNVNAMLKKM